MMLNCNQCGFQHPPLTSEMEGKCPMAKNNTVEVQGEKVMANNLMDAVRDIIQNQIKVKELSDLESLEQFLVVSIAKLMKDYIEPEPEPEPIPEEKEEVMTD